MHIGKTKKSAKRNQGIYLLNLGLRLSIPATLWITKSFRPPPPSGGRIALPRYSVRVPAVNAFVPFFLILLIINY